MLTRRNFVGRAGLLLAALYSASKLTAVSRAEYLRSPSKEKILLRETDIAGVQYYDADRIKDELRPGEKLILKKEPANKYDDMAIEVFTRNGYKLGYIPRIDNEVPFNLMEQDIEVSAFIDKVNLPFRYGFNRDIVIKLYQKQ